MLKHLIELADYLSKLPPKKIFILSLVSTFFSLILLFRLKEDGVMIMDTNIIGFIPDWFYYLLCFILIIHFVSITLRLYKKAR